MTQAKSRAKKASPSKDGEAARAEKTDGPNVMDFRGLSLELPKKPPLSLALRARQLKKEADGDEFSAELAVLEIVLGPKQFEAILNKCDEDGLNLDDDAEVIADLFEAVQGAIGIGAGES